ncbi:hypothetical protein AUJ17_03125 [Candidatus Micrarchaeota archaeon CG1_02_47_40]|nr:MAG: hypothetical protein AUJ17_03125 [Candidatus Micrarchaeota archaeon CG1_02_47_40]
MLIDVTYTMREGKPVIVLLMKGKRFFRLYDANFEPYFYLDAPKKEIPKIEKAKAPHAARAGLIPQAARVEEEERIIEGKTKALLKVFCNFPAAVPLIREELREFGAYEYRIQYAKRYMMDRGWQFFSRITYIRKGKYLQKILKCTPDVPLNFNTLAFDIETYNPQGMPKPKDDPVIMVSYATRKEAKVLTYKKIDKSFVETLKDEERMISEFCNVLKKEDVEFLVGYNSSVFDLPYLGERASALGVRLELGRDGSSFSVRKFAQKTIAKIRGRVHVDAYPIIRFMGLIGSLKISRYTLENAYIEITGKKSETKGKVQRLEIHKMWDDEKQLPLLAEYSRNDARETLEIAQRVLPMQIEMSKLVGLSLADVSTSTAGQLVESLLMFRSCRQGIIIPNKPHEGQVKERELNPIQGAFVKLPKPGIYDNMVVFDFRGLYPSIICSHNIDPYTLLPKGAGESDAYTSPLGHRFAKSPQGIIPKVLEEVVHLRSELKGKLKKLEPDSEEYSAVFAKSQALKILANSYYGYLAYARSRWYSRECAESVTAWGRHFIQHTISEAEKCEFEVLYGDTDSIFLLLGKKKKEDALSFMEKINKSLPGNMELELEGFYPRGVFVTKKVDKEGKGAKKKYALIDEKGRIKIRGFELVRRDWSAIAKKTQGDVLMAILKEGSKENAVKIVKDTIERLRTGKVPLEELTIYTQLKKDPSNYEIMSPELSAAKKAIKRGVKLEKGAMIGYVIAKKGASISEKAEIAEYAKDYDADYYINRQILPSVLKILAELGFSEDDLKFAGSQSNLGKYF